MCGRFALALSHHEIRQTLGEELDDWIDQDRFRPRYNIAPHSHAPVIRRRYTRRDNDDGDEAADQATEKATEKDSSSIQSQLVLHTMKWGVVPHWSKYEDPTLQTTNARSENLVQGGGMWNSMKSKKRCVVVCQGYYEWLKKGKDKLPHYTRHKSASRLMLLAGLYDSVVLTGEKEALWTFAIVTTDANKQFSWLHDRQPVILTNKASIEAWLDTSSQTWTPELSELVKPYSDKKSPLECYQVPKEVGKVGTESETFIHPVKNRKDGIQAMFSKQKQSQSKTSVKQGSPASALSSRSNSQSTSATPSPPTGKGEGSTKPSGALNVEVVNIDKTKSVDPITPEPPSSTKRKREESNEADSKPPPEVINIDDDDDASIAHSRSPTRASKKKVKIIDVDASPSKKITSFFSSKS